MGSSGPLFHSVSYGQAVICSNVGHLKEDIDNQVTGILVENNNWGQALCYAVENPALISSIELNVAKKAAERSPRKIAERCLSLYRFLRKELDYV